MMMHTPEPWKFQRADNPGINEENNHLIFNEQKRHIAEVFQYQEHEHIIGLEEAASNAHLIAAAPELYKELTNANEWLKRLRANVKDGYASLPVNITALDATMLYVKQAIDLVEKEK